MQKQTRIDGYLVHKQNKNKSKINQKHESSRQNSDTQVILQQEFEQRHNENLNSQACQQMIMIGPFDNIYSQLTKKKLRNITQNYTKDNFFQYLSNNYKYLKLNVDNLKQIRDEKFFSSTVKRLLKYLNEKGQDKIVNIKTLIKKSSQIVMISREQALLILICMFLGIMPHQTFQFTTTFGHFLDHNYDNPSNNKCRIQKLKCIINYFNMIVDEDKKVLQEQYITFQRASTNINLDSQNYDRSIYLRPVQVQTKKIEQYYRKAAMVDFANSKIGGGVLRSGCVQQQILFLIFPQALISKLISYEMDQKQAIIMYGLKRFSNYRNYSYAFQFDSPFFDVDDSKQISVLIAIDAVNYNQKYSKQVQYCKGQIHRQITKAYIGFSAIQFAASSDMPICTGRWGCGAFGGDEVWKFLIQWIACSQAGRNMIYQTDTEDMVKIILRIIRQLDVLTTLDLLSILQAYGKAKANKQIPFKMQILEYIQKYV